MWHGPPGIVSSTAVEYVAAEDLVMNSNGTKAPTLNEAAQACSDKASSHIRKGRPGPPDHPLYSGWLPPRRVPLEAGVPPDLLAFVWGSPPPRHTREDSCV
jgi:hypothetical protein